MRLVSVAIVLILTLTGCGHRAVSVSALIGMDPVEALYLLNDGRWVCADSLSWSDRSWYRELRFDTDGNGVWNYLYAEVYDDVAGWTWLPYTVRINPLEEPDLARTKRHLVRERDAPPCQPGLDDFGYTKQ